MTELRLLTLNALMRGDVRPRLHALGRILERSRYDIVCLQEVLLRSHAGLVQRLAVHYPHHARSGSVLLHGGLVLLSRHPIRTARFTRYPRVGPARREYLMRKGAQLAVVETPAGPLAIANTHLSANRDGDWSPANRYTRVHRAELGHLASELGPDRPTVVVGDLNVPRDSVALAEFLAATGLTDPLAGDPGPTFRPTDRWPDPPAFDHVLVRSLTARPAPVFQDPVPWPGGRRGFLSDHYGVEASLTLPAAGR